MTQSSSDTTVDFPSTGKITQNEPTSCDSQHSKYAPCSWCLIALLKHSWLATDRPVHLSISLTTIPLSSYSLFVGPWFWTPKASPTTRILYYFDRMFTGCDAWRFVNTRYEVHRLMWCVTGHPGVHWSVHSGNFWASSWILGLNFELVVHKQPQHTTAPWCGNSIKKMDKFLEFFFLWLIW